MHRIGRTGRAGAQGEAVSLVCVDENGFLRDIERLIKREIPKEIVPGFEPPSNERPEPIVLGRMVIGEGAGRGGTRRACGGGRGDGGARRLGRGHGRSRQRRPRRRPRGRGRMVTARRAAAGGGRGSPRRSSAARAARSARPTAAGRPGRAGRPSIGLGPLQRRHAGERSRVASDAAAPSARPAPASRPARRRDRPGRPGTADTLARRPRAAVGRDVLAAPRRCAGARRRPAADRRIVDFDRAAAALPAVDDVYIALGTTITVAGSRGGLSRRRPRLVVAVARAARAAGATRLALVSAHGADPRSRDLLQPRQGRDARRRRRARLRLGRLSPGPRCCSATASARPAGAPRRALADAPLGPLPAARAPPLRPIAAAVCAGAGRGAAVERSRASRILASARDAEGAASRRPPT